MNGRRRLLRTHPVVDEAGNHFSHVEPLFGQGLLFQSRVFQKRVDHMREAQCGLPDDADVMFHLLIAGL